MRVPTVSFVIIPCFVLLLAGTIVVSSSAFAFVPSQQQQQQQRQNSHTLVPNQLRINNRNQKNHNKKKKNYHRILQLHAEQSNVITSTTTTDQDARTKRRDLEENNNPSILPQQQQQHEEQQPSSFSYLQFAQDYPVLNNVLLASFKTAFADFVAQTVIAQTPVTELDVPRVLLFAMFGCIYSGFFQYAYQVQIFKRLFDVDKFTNQSWSDKLQDTQGLQALAAQTALDLTVLTLVYLPSFYIFKASVFSGSSDPVTWMETGLDNYQTNFAKDELDLLRVWFPADLVTFSVALYLRLPVRHVIAFVWTAYLSFARGGH